MCIYKLYPQFITGPRLSWITFNYVVKYVFIYTAPEHIPIWDVTSSNKLLIVNRVQNKDTRLLLSTRLHSSLLLSTSLCKCHLLLAQHHSLQTGGYKTSSECRTVYLEHSRKDNLSTYHCISNYTAASECYNWTFRQQNRQRSLCIWQVLRQEEKCRKIISYFSVSTAAFLNVLF